MMIARSHANLFWLVQLLPLPGASQSTLSRPIHRSEQIRSFPVDSEFKATVEALKLANERPAAVSMDAFSSSIMATDLKSRPDQIKMLSKLQYSVFDLPETEQEGNCRGECVHRFLAAQEDIEEALCEGVQGAGSAISSSSGAANGDGMTKESCAKGVDAGLYLGCQAWCDPRISTTHTTFRHDDIHRLANRTRQGLNLLRETCNEVQGRSVRIQLLEAKAARQPVETAACEFGFRGGFASVVITEQRLNGVDKLNLPIAFWEHNPMDNPRRRRFFYWFGGTDTQLRAEQECEALYRDEPEWLADCLVHMRSRWEAEAGVYYFAARDPLSQLGGEPMRLRDLPLLYQSIETVNADGEGRSSHVVMRNAEQSSGEAASLFCSGVFGLATEPYLSECRGVMSKSLRIESEAEDVAELKRIRMY